MKKRIASVLAATAAAGTILTLTAAPAQADVNAPATSTAAAANCGGSLLRSYPLNYNGTKIGELAVYFDGSRNCARMNHAGPTYGVPLRTTAFIVACRETTPGPRCTYDGTPDTDDGTYSYYAGPVYASARNKCIHAAGDIYYAGAKRHVQVSPVAAHCR